jgi:hypothetical protein
MIGPGTSVPGIFSSKGSGGSSLPINLFTENLILPANRVHNLNGRQFTFYNEDGNTSFFLDNYANTTGSRPGFIGRRARGTRDTPLALLNNDLMFAFGARGYTGTQFTTTARGLTSVYADGDWSDSSQPTRITIGTTPINGTAQLDRITVKNNGFVGINTVAPSSLLEAQAINGNSGERVFGIRNHTNTGWLAEFRNNGIVGIGGSANASYQQYIQSSLGFSSQIDNYATSGIGQRITMFGGGTPTALILNAFNGSVNTALSIANGGIQLPLTGEGTKIGMSTGDKFAFWGATPQVQQVFATGTGKTADDVITFLQSIGLCRQS